MHSVTWISTVGLATDSAWLPGGAIGDSQMYTPPSKCSQYNQPPFHLMEGGRGIWNAGEEAEPARQRCQCCSQHWLARTCVTHGRGVQDCTRKRFLSSSSARRIDGDRAAIVLDAVLLWDLELD